MLGLLSLFASSARVIYVESVECNGGRGEDWCNSYQIMSRREPWRRPLAVMGSVGGCA